MLGSLVVGSSRDLRSLVYLDGDARSNRVAALRNKAAHAIHELCDPREGKLVWPPYSLVPESESRRSFITVAGF